MNDKPNSLGPASLAPKLGMLLLAIASLVMLSRLVGCHAGTKPTAGPGTTTGKTTATLEPVELLRQMIKKYHEAPSYRDRGRLILTYKRNGQRVPEQSWDWAVQFVRPGKLKIDAYNLHLASDAGQQLVARVEDAESGNIDNQVVVRPALGKVSLETLASDQILFSQLIGRIQRPPVQLELLFGERALASLFASNIKLAFADDETIDEHLCHCLEATASEGKFVFWIDAQSQLLRRLEYPVASLLADLTTDPLVAEARLYADLVDATFSPDVSQLDFTLPLPRDAKQVRAFVPPPLPLASIPLGKNPTAFEFTRLDGQTIDPASIEGKPAALFWYAHHPVCEKPAQEFAAAIQTLDLHAALVCTEPPDVGDKAVLEQIAAWKIKLSPARDLKDYRGRVFQVSELPAITLLDRAGKIQWMASGPEALAEFPKAVARLQNGEDLAAIALEEHKQLLAQYHKLVAAGGPQIATGTMPATKPAKLKLKKKWELADFAAPGGLVAVGERLLVVAGTSSVWEVNAQGEVVAKHELDLAIGGAISAIRAFTSEKQTIYAVFNPLQPGVYVFDEKWQPLFSYPKEEPLPVRDVQLGDLNADGEPEIYIAFEGTIGLHAVSAKGERLWTNRAYAPLVSVALSHEIPKFGRVAYVTGRGGICGLTADGEVPPKDVAGWSVAHLFTSRFSGATQSPYLAVGAKEDGKPCAIGLDELLAEKWSYPLASGAFARPVDFATSGQLRAGSKGEWLVAWADGAIHIVSEDGEFDDMFHTGAELRGIALLKSSETSLLVVTTANGALCWEVGE